MDYNEILMTLVTGVVIPAIIILGKALYKYIEENIKDKNVRKYLLIATDCVADSVASIAQTYVDKVSADGWNEETKREAFELAKNTALENLGITGRKLLTEALGDFDKWVNTKVEAEVKRLAVK